jgi:uncharacterized membrane protein
MMIQTETKRSSYFSRRLFRFCNKLKLIYNIKKQIHRAPAGGGGGGGVGGVDSGV